MLLEFVILMGLKIYRSLVFDYNGLKIKRPINSCALQIYVKLQLIFVTNGPESTSLLSPTNQPPKTHPRLEPLNSVRVMDC